MKIKSKRLQSLMRCSTLSAHYKDRWAHAWYDDWAKRWYIAIGDDQLTAFWKGEFASLEELEVEMRDFANLRHWVVLG